MFLSQTNHVLVRRGYISSLTPHMGNGDWPCCGKSSIDNQVSIIDPQPWDMVCKIKRHLECVVLPTTFGNVPVFMPRYHCRKLHCIWLILVEEVKEGTVLRYASRWLFWDGTYPDIFYLWACVFIYIILYVCFLFFIIFICAVCSYDIAIIVVVVVVVVDEICVTVMSILLGLVLFL